MTDKLPIVEARAALDDIGKRLEDHNQLYVEQRFSWLELATQGICEIPNTYRIFGGTDNTGPLLLVAQERSGACSRCCCAPVHSLVLEISPAEDPSNVLLSLERPGCKLCCCAAPKPCLPCCACTHACTDEVIMHEGKVEGEAGKIVTPKIVGMVRQPDGGGGGCTPTVEIFAANGENERGEPSAYVQGPYIFGGCSECCCEAQFPVSRKPDRSGDLALIKHLTPKTCSDLCAEACTDTDKFSVSFAGGITPEERAQILSATFLTDYMFFEQDNGMIRCSSGKIIITFFQCYCYGCLCPCMIVISS